MAASRAFAKSARSSKNCYTNRRSKASLRQLKDSKERRSLLIKATRAATLQSSPDAYRPTLYKFGSQFPRKLPYAL